MGDTKGTSERGFLRGLQNYGDRDFSIYMRRAFAKSMGYSGDELKRPVVGIAFTHSKFNPCHRHSRSCWMP
jgi:dihydroxy-acid dehydratase